MSDETKNVTRNDDWLYSDGDSAYESVTTVLKHFDTDTTGLDIWKKQNSGIGDKADWRHLLWYSQNRGTLLHYHVLNQLSQTELWSEDEQESIEELQQYNDDTARLYSLLRYKKRDIEVKDRGYFYDNFASSTIMNLFDQDKRWFMQKAETYIDELIKNPIAVEQMLHSDKLELGGQVDLVYEDYDGNTVVADLKTSSSLRGKHILQGYLYATMLVEQNVVDTVDRIEVWQMNPETEVSVIHSHENVSVHHSTKDWWNDEWDNYEWSSHEAIVFEIYKCLQIQKNGLGEESDDTEVTE
jgi:hypothetical protein